VAEPAPAVGSKILVRKLRPDGSTSFTWTATLVEATEEAIHLHAPFNVDRVDLGFAVFERGDLFEETYPLHHHYNVFRVSSPAGALKGWYCNVATPPWWQDGELRYVDLVLDLWRAPDGAIHLLDEDELAALVDAGGLTPELQAAAEVGWRELQQVAKHRLR